jgi:hypothetical protein
MVGLFSDYIQNSLSLHTVDIDFRYMQFNDQGHSYTLFMHLASVEDIVARSKFFLLSPKAVPSLQ